MMKQLEQSYAVRDKQDVLAMCSLQYATKLIQKNNFQENHSAYELKKSHHDHLICTKCGSIIEFVNEDLEKLQEHISKKYNFSLESHVMTLFGNCNKKDCKNLK